MSKAQRESLNYINETCPKVNELEEQCIEIIIKDLELCNIPDMSDLSLLIQRRVATLVGKIKEHATEPMRSALVEVCSDLQEARSEVESKAYEISCLQDKVDNLECELAYCSSEVSRLTHELESIL